jgi:uncharacterized protein YjbI with pentapeptide repeats
MGTRLRSWWQQIKRPLMVVGIVAASVLMIVLIVGIIGGYIFNWNWTGLGPYTSPPHTSNSDFQRGKTLWDWMQLLFIPVVLAIGGYLFSLSISKNEHVITLDNQREAALNAYIDNISELLLHENLRESKPDTEIRDIARARTLALLQRLDATRKGSVLKFLYETGLIKGDNCVIDLSDADLTQVSIYPGLLLNLQTTLNAYDLSEINLKYAHLEKACLAATRLRGANLSGAMLHNANLTMVDLSGANLRRSLLFYTQLDGAKLDGAILDEAIIITSHVTQEQLDKAKSLKGATMPDRSIHD